MKNPLHYQLSEYDCGPTSLLNAVSYLFEREELPPEIIRNIMLYSLDCYGADGVSGKSGTSRMAMMFLANWLSGVGQAGLLPVSARHMSGGEVHLGASGVLRDALRRGGAAVVRLEMEGEHYVLLTGIEGDDVFLFDPYYQTEAFPDGRVRLVADRPCACNRIVPASYFEGPPGGLYSLGAREEREAVILFNDRTKLTEENTVEYFI